jgi:protein-L-isoaspartate(D-aspartate) O-methyltransferase
VVRKDSLKHKGLRNQLANQLEARGIHNESVLEAIRTVPRHLFLDKTLEAYAYEDRAIPIGAEQTISHPYTVAFQTELLELQPKMKVLEIGTGSGYQSAILSYLEAEVYSVERQLELFRKAEIFFSTFRWKPKLIRYADGYKGLPEFAPFDRIVVTAGAKEVPKALLAQLKIGGILVIPVGEEQQKMTVIERKGSKEFHKTVYGDFQFVPLLNSTEGVKR